VIADAATLELIDVKENEEVKAYEDERVLRAYEALIALKLFEDDRA